MAALRERIIDLARTWDEESVEPPEDFADALIADLGLEFIGWQSIYGGISTYVTEGNRVRPCFATATNGS